MEDTVSAYCHRLLAGSSGDAYEKVEASRVLFFVFAVLVFVIILELFLHYLEHKTKQSPKYADMLHKTTQELMIVGLIYLMVKFCIAAGLAKKNGLVYQAMDFADLLILFTVLAMVLQALLILVRLRKPNQEISKASIVRSDVLLTSAKQSVDATQQSFWLYRYFAWTKWETQVQMKLLRSLFLRTYGLPQLFPFDKYIEDVQNSQVAHLVEIDISIWVVLMMAYALFFTLSGELLHGGEFKSTDKTRWVDFAGFSLSLFLLMCLLLAYLRHLVNLLLQHAAQYADVLGANWTSRNMRSPPVMLEALGHVAQQEAEMPHLSSHQAIEQMRNIADELSDHAHHHGHGGLIAHIFAHDMLLGLLGSACRRARRGKKAHEGKAKGKLHSDNVRLPYFSRKFVHFVVQLLFILNGFYYALFVLCVMYLDGFNVMAVIKSLLMCLPLFLNTFVLAPNITREFSIINGVFRVDASKLSAIVEHFCEVQAVKDDMVHQVLLYLHHNNKTVADVQRALAAADANDDVAGDGYIDMDVLRGVLKQFGYRFPRQKFVTFVRLQFDAKGTTIRYADLIKLLNESESSKVQSLHVPVDISQRHMAQLRVSEGVEPRGNRPQASSSQDFYFI
ncbi:unnamed protein product [Aphanomyces euteiches]|uniref:EF-hand domain-containing protein n=1 Tax=Aphanomyces euteiches TaxID=100861 RepID=A0A6G0WQ64_9STRA|nr:hypothetical protein Ae201684_012801 [Aphanomyces euteiches]KAH9097599.1 hypothetical protein Ae201684P_001075 [Aphanomyces euteiches]